MLEHWLGVLSADVGVEMIGFAFAAWLGWFGHDLFLPALHCL